jgi:chemotaxis protein MotA
MSRSNAIGAALCIAVFIATFALAGNAAAYLNLEAMLVVVSGTVGATLLSYPLGHIRTACLVARGAYRHGGTNPDDVIGVLLDLAIRSRVDGLQSLEHAGERTTFNFLREALNMVADNYAVDDIRDILMTEIHFFKIRRHQQERVFRAMAAYAPAFGLAGSVIGLIGLLFGLGNTGEILKYIPVALISTLYGILLGTFVLAPVAENIRGKTEREILVHKLIVEGVTAIKTETNPHVLEKKLSSFLTPAARRETRESFDEMRRRYLKLARQRREAEPAPEGSPAEAAGLGAGPGVQRRR